jgi:hypothetical protein
MKSLGFYLTHLMLLAALAACGGNNESGKNSTYSSSNPYGYYPGTYTNVTATGIGYGNYSLDSVLAQTPCITTGSTAQRMQIQLPLTNFPSVIPAGDLYVGVTTAGDVSILLGQGTNAPLFIAYLCPRSYTSTTGQLLDIATGTTTRCNFKPLVRATMVLPGYSTPLYFRYLDGGRMNPTTQQMIPYTAPVCL